MKVTSIPKWNYTVSVSHSIKTFTDLDKINFCSIIFFLCLVAFGLLLSILIRNAISTTDYNLSNNYNLNNIGTTITGNNAEAVLTETGDDNQDANVYTETNNINTDQKSISEASTNHAPPQKTAIPPQIKPLGQTATPAVKIVQNAKPPTAPIKQHSVAKVTVAKPPIVIQVKKPINRKGYSQESNIGTYSLSQTGTPSSM